MKHAHEMAPALDDPGLHEFTGGRPDTAQQLAARYARLTAAQPDPDAAEGWLTWLVRQRAANTAIGFVQATLRRQAQGEQAELAWVIGTRHQRHGYGSEAARAMVTWLTGNGITSIIAHIHPDHRASAAVARSVGMRPSAEAQDGETRWTASAPRGLTPGSGQPGVQLVKPGGGEPVTRGAPVRARRE